MSSLPHDPSFHLSRRALLAGALALSCSKRKPDAETTPPPAPSFVIPEDGSAAPPGATRLLEWRFDGPNGGPGFASVLVPAWGNASARYPVLIALHGRGEAQKSPERGALGWPRDYALQRAIARVSAPPLRSDDLEDLYDGVTLGALNRKLQDTPFRGVIVVCPYMPDIDVYRAEQVRPYGRFLLETVLPRVWKELPAFEAPSCTGIDGVSLGGGVALRVGLENPTRFGAIGTLQPACDSAQATEFTELARRARLANPKLALRLLTSRGDYFRGPVGKISEAWRSAGIQHDYLDVPGPHDYPFNRGPGAVEMLLWHDRLLDRG